MSIDRNAQPAGAEPPGDTNLTPTLARRVPSAAPPPPPALAAPTIEPLKLRKLTRTRWRFVALVMVFLVPTTVALTLAAVWLFFPGIADPMSRAQLAKTAKAATALVEVKGRGGNGSAFCIHSSGLFLANAHVVQGDVTLVLSPGQKAEKAYPAGVIRMDKEQDLALLRVGGVKDLPALSLGSDTQLEELMTVWAFGYPSAPAPGQGAAFSAHEASIRSLPLKDGRPPRIHLNAALDAGETGGPLLDGRGQVIGVVVGVQGGVSFAVPVSTVTAFLDRPDVQFTPPLLGPGSFHKPAQFEARVTPVFPSAAPLTVDLVLKSSKGEERKYAMKADGNTYRVTAVPLPVAGPLSFRLRAQFEDGSLDATATNCTFKVGGREVNLGEVRGIRREGAPQVLLHDGSRVKGKLSGLNAVDIRLGEQALTASLATAVEVECSPETDQVSCTLIVRLGGKEIFRQSQGLMDVGLIKNPGFEAELEGWQIYTNPHRPQFEFDTDVAREGWQSLRVIHSGPPTDTACYQEMMLKPGQWYRFSGWVRTRGLFANGAGAYGTFQIHARGINDIIAKGSNHGGNTDWTEVSLTFQARPDGLTRIIAHFVGFGAGTGTAWFDGLKLVEVSQPPG